ncbi:Imm63 family immunity protein [uncultured Acinetobacter sp.]|uniref:Imm63 family immunity protein n=1 Tax=uncultured Acinetobacter sp. TaxID=165433 RepID=UPI00258D7A53|nr:Imm63 family immunity protein [uncultured Acinetobacter sp.]
MMLNFNEIQEKIYEYGSIINAPKDILKIYPSPQPNGIPYIQINNNEYLYIVEERGIELERRRTANIDVLLYWIMSDVIFFLATQYELENRIENFDNRRLIFKKEVELFKVLKKDWANITEVRINKILEESPYND